MSNVIDSRVVEMRFDNGQFEKGVQQSMSTLDKLKQSLNFSNIGDVGSKLNLGSVSSAIETAGEKFSVFEQIAIGALRRIGEQGIDYLSAKIKSLSLDQIQAGWDKYGEMTSNVATIMAATGDDIDTVSAQMEKLLYFTDETSYNFTDMANNIGKFTANGIGLDSATQAMEGIATWAAKSGQNAGTASRVMYNLAQAIGMGALKLQDWKSVELANMGTKEFKEMAIQAGLASGTLRKVGDQIVTVGKNTAVSVSNFRETLAEGWLDTNTLMGTLNEYGKAAELISQIHDQTGLYASDMMDLVEKQRAGTLTTKDMAAALEMSEEELKANQEFADSLSESIQKLASDEYKFSLEAYRAGQEARTFKDAIDATKDAVSSGWMKTFELIFGKYDKAKTLWTGVAEGLYDIFTNGQDARNQLLKDWGPAGQDILAEGILNTLTAINDMLNMVKGTWQKFFGGISSEGLLNATRNFRDFTESLKLYNEEGKKLTATGEKVQSVLNKIFSAGQNVGKIFSNIGRIIGDFVKSLSPAADAAKNLANSLYELFMSVSGRLGDYLETVDLTDQFAKVSQFAAEAINFLAQKVDEIRIKFDAWKPGDTFGLLGDVLQAVKEKVSDFFKTTEDGVTPFQKVVNMFDSLAEKAKNLKNVFQPLKDFFKDFWEGLKEALDLKGVTNVFEGIAKIFGNIFDTLKKILSNFTVGDALKAAAAYIGVQALKLGNVIPKLGKNITELVKTVKNMLGNFGENGIFGTLFGEMDEGGIMGKLFPTGGNSVVKTIKTVATSLLELGGALLMIAAALAIVAAIKPENLIKAVATLTTTLGLVGAELVGLTKLMKVLKVNPAELIAVAAAIAIVSAALIVLAGALEAFVLIAKQGPIVIGGLATMAATLAIVATALGLLAKAAEPGPLLAAAAAIAVVSASLLLMAVALEAFVLIAKQGIACLDGLGAMALTVGIVATALGVLAKKCGGGELLAAGVAIALVSASLLVMAAALEAFVLIANQGVAAAVGLLTLVAVLTAVSAALVVLAGVGPAILLGAAALVAASVAVVALSAGLAAAAIAVAVLGAAIAIAIGAVGIAVGVAIAAVATGISVAVITVSAAVTAVVAAVSASVAMLAAALGSGISSLVTGISEAAAAIATAIGTIITVISQGLAEGVSALAEGLAAVISALATGIGGAIDGLATGIGGAIAGLGEGIGASIAAVGAGIGAAFAEVGNGIANGISAISKSIGSFGDSITSIGQGIENFGISVKTLSFIDMVSIGHGLVELAKGLKEINKNPFKGDASQVQSYAEALQNLSQVSTQITTLGENLKLTMLTLGSEMAQNLANGIQNGIATVQSAATTIVNNLKVSFDGAVAESTRSGTAIGTEFVRGIQNGIGGAQAAGSQLAQAAAQGAQSLTGHFPAIGYNFVAGLTQGVYSGSGMLSGAVQSVVNQAVNAARSAAQVQSPSKVFAKIGKFFSLGMAKGIDQGASAVVRSTDDMVNTAIDGVSNAMTKILDTLNSDVDMDPVITPVLDLSNVQSNSKKLNQMLDKNMSIDTAGDISMNHTAMQKAALDQQNRGVVASIDPALAAALMNQANSGPIEFSVNFNGDLAQLAAVLQPAIVQETNRIGKSLINA